jgi:hypothetical protein
MTDPRLSIEDIRAELQQQAESLAEASDNLERLIAELGWDLPNLEEAEEN